jgi:uncharacterized membrane protein
VRLDPRLGRRIGLFALAILAIGTIAIDKAMEERTIRRAFRISLWLKLAISMAEVLGGLGFALISYQAIQDFARAITAGEMIEDPSDIVAGFLQHIMAGFTSSAQSFAAWYLLSHGLLKLVMVIGVLANKLWAYPGFIIVLTGFIIYQSYKLSHHITVPLVALTVLDIVVLVLAWHEYRLVRTQQVDLQ